MRIKKLSFYTKLIIFLEIFLIATNLAVGFFVWQQLTQKVRDISRTRLVTIASTAAAMISVEAHEKIWAEEDENGEAYARVKTVLKKIVDSNPGVDDIYTYRKTERENIWAFAVTAYDTQDKDGNGTIEEDEEKVVVGEEFDVTQYESPEMEQSFAVSSADQEPSCDIWGCWLSGYAPIFDQGGQAVAAVGVDISAEDIVAFEKNTKIILLAVFGILVAILPLIFYLFLRIMFRKEKEIDRAKSEFVSLASHQLLTPLSNVNWRLEMLLDGSKGDLSGEQKMSLSKIYGAGRRMTELVSTFLNVSRIELGTFMIETAPIDLKNMVKSVIDDLRPLILLKNIGIAEKYQEDLSPFCADSKLMRIIIQNLLSNALKYTPARGKIEVEISDGSATDAKMEKSGGDLLIRVADTGYGIPESQKDKIFTKLFRADNIKEKDVEGTGLGLYIVKSIVEKAGGRIWFESEENSGTTFFVTFSSSGMKTKKGSRKLS